MKKKLRAENDFVKFDTPLSPKPVFFRKARSSAAAPAGSPAAQVRTRGFLGGQAPSAAQAGLAGARGCPEGSPGGLQVRWGRAPAAAWCGIRGSGEIGRRGETCACKSGPAGRGGAAAQPRWAPGA